MMWAKKIKTHPGLHKKQNRRKQIDFIADQQTVQSVACMSHEVVNDNDSLQAMASTTN